MSSALSRSHVTHYNRILPSCCRPANQFVILLPLPLVPEASPPPIHLGRLNPSPTLWSHFGVWAVSKVFLTRWLNDSKKVSFSGSTSGTCWLSTLGVVVDACCSGRFRSFGGTDIIGAVWFWGLLGTWERSGARPFPSGAKDEWPCSSRSIKSLPSRQDPVP